MKFIIPRSANSSLPFSLMSVSPSSPLVNRPLAAPMPHSSTPIPMLSRISQSVTQTAPHTASSSGLLPQLPPNPQYTRTTCFVRKERLTPHQNFSWPSKYLFTSMMSPSSKRCLYSQARSVKSAQLISFITPASTDASLLTSCFLYLSTIFLNEPWNEPALLTSILCQRFLWYSSFHPPSGGFDTSSMKSFTES